MNSIIVSLLTIYLLIINLIAFCMMISDKHKAKRRQYRIPEATLFGLAFAGGSVGIFLGMQIARHKTQHPKFFIGIPVIILLQVGVIVAIFSMIF